MHGHDGSAPQKPAEIDFIPHLLAVCGDHAHRRGLVVDHADGGFVCYDSGNGRSGRIAGDGDHVEPHRADAGHCFQLVERDFARLRRFDHADVLGNGDERAREPAHARGRHDAALLDGIVEHGERRRRAVPADNFQPELFEDVRDGISPCRGGCKRKIDDAEARPEALGSLFCDKLTCARDLECGAFDGLRGIREVGIGHELQRVLDDAGAGNAHVDDGIRLPRAVEGARHEGVVLYRVAEDDELRAAQ